MAERRVTCLQHFRISFREPGGAPPRVLLNLSPRQSAVGQFDAVAASCGDPWLCFGARHMGSPSRLYTKLTCCPQLDKR